MNRSVVVLCAVLCIALGAGQLAADPVVIDPGAFASGTPLNTAFQPGATIRFGGYESRWGAGYPGNPRGMEETIIAFDGITPYGGHPLGSCDCYQNFEGDTKVFGFIPNDPDSPIAGRIRPAWGYLQIDFDEPVSFVEAKFLLSDSADPAHMFLYDYYYDPSQPDSSQPPLPISAMPDPTYPGHWISLWNTPGTSGAGSIEYLPERYTYTFEEPTILSVRMSGGAGGIEQREGQDICIVGFQYSVDPYYGPVVPEPASAVLLLIGVAGLILVRYRRK